MTPDIDLLLDAVEDGEPAAAKELAVIMRAALEEPDRTVAVAFGLRAQALRARNEAIWELPRFLPEDLNLTDQARTIMREYKQYRSRGHVEHDPKRRIFQRIVASGAPFPKSIKHLGRILKQKQWLTTDIEAVAMSLPFPDGSGR